MKAKYVLPAMAALLLPALFTGCTQQHTPAPAVTPTAVAPSVQVSASASPPATPHVIGIPTPTKTATVKATTAPTPKVTKSVASMSTVSTGKKKALMQLAELTVKEADYSVTYNRTKDFGPAWYDYDHNGCDTRNDVLTHTLTHIVYRANDPTCTVASGVLHDPYTGKEIDFTRGVKTSEAVEVDHIFPLALAFRHGAANWSENQRLRYANDQKTVLLAVDGPSNEEKSDSGPADWMPSNYGYRCTYVEKFTNVAAVYKLTMSRRDAAKVRSVLATCN